MVGTACKRKLPVRNQTKGKPYTDTSEYFYSSLHQWTKLQGHLSRNLKVRILQSCCDCVVILQSFCDCIVIFQSCCDCVVIFQSSTKVFLYFVGCGSLVTSMLGHPSRDMIMSWVQFYSRPQLKKKHKAPWALRMTQPKIGIRKRDLGQ